MPGRYAVTLPPEAVRRFFGYVEQVDFPPRYNIAPTQPVPIVRAARAATGGFSRHFGLVRWGFLPGFVKDPRDFPLLINARAESLLERASFRNAIKRRRCLFIADAFYEWQRDGHEKANGRPFLLRRADGAPLGIAGLWETWMGPNGEEVDTACIITTDANGATTALHDRLPAILEPEVFDLWLTGDESRVDEALRLLKPPANDVLEFFEIGPAVNKVANDSPDVQTPVSNPAPLPAPKVTEDPDKPAQGSLF